MPPLAAPADMTNRSANDMGIALPTLLTRAPPRSPRTAPSDCGTVVAACSRKEEVLP